jgi:SAM-dependent methyltransferase
VRRCLPEPKPAILNAGCGGNDYGLRADLIVNLDISMRHCEALPHAVVGDIETIPFPNDCFDATVSVGAVLNYVRPERAIPELVRVTRPGGLILVDFESSWSAEIMFSSHWRKPVSVIERLYVDRMDKTYLFSPGFVRTMFEDHGAVIVASGGYHIATALWERIFTKALIPRAAFAIDPYIGAVPALRPLASSILFAFRRHAPRKAA